MAPRLRLVGWLVPLSLAVLLAQGGQAPAQTLNEGWENLTNRYGTVSSRISSFRKGERVDPNDKSQLEAIDLLAKLHTYGVYLQKQDNPPPGKPGMDRAYTDFVTDIRAVTLAKDRQTMQPFGDVLRDRVRIHALEVLEFDQARPIHKLHNARVLAKVAELGQPELADTLIKLLKDDKQNDGVRYYVLRGLATLLAQVQPPDMTPVVAKPRQVNCAEAIVAFLKQRKGPSKDAPPEEIDGFRLLRREAIRALAQIHIPAINDKVRPALVLARFAGNDASIQPPPRIDERVEAAIGLARMQSAQNKQYQADYAAGQIAKCLGVFAQTFDKELSNLKDKKELQTRPWRIDALMLKDALMALKTDSGKNAYASQVATRGMTVLNAIIQGRAVEANEVSWWITSESDPPSKELFQGSADSVVKPAAPAEAESEK